MLANPDGGAALQATRPIEPKERLLSFERVRQISRGA